MNAPYKRPILASIYRVIASIVLVLGILAIVPLANFVAGAVAIFSAFVILGLSQIFDLIGRIEYNTRPETHAAAARQAAAEQARATRPAPARHTGSITGI